MGVIAHDITDRKLAGEAIAEEKERLAITLRSIGDGVITTDTRGNIVIINKVAEELAGWNQDEARGKRLVRFSILSTESPVNPAKTRLISCCHRVISSNLQIIRS